MNIKPIFNYFIGLSFLFILSPTISSLSNGILLRTTPTMSISEANAFIQKEREKNDIDEDITLRIVEDNALEREGLGGYCLIGPEGDYIIGVQKNRLSKYILSHELCHIQKDFDEAAVSGGYNSTEDLNIMKHGECNNTFKYQFFQEPRATFYGFLGIFK